MRLSTIILTLLFGASSVTAQTAKPKYRLTWQDHFRGKTFDSRSWTKIPRIQTDKEGQYPFDRPYYLLIDMQTEGSWVGKAIKSELPVEMEIDWVKMYDLVE